MTGTSRTIGNCGKHLLLLVSIGQLLLLTITGHAQDSFQNGPSLKDTVAINRLLQKAYTFRETASDSSAMLYSQGLEASKHLNYREGIAESLCGLGRYYNIKNVQEKAMAYLHMALPYCGNDTKGKDLAIAIHLLLSESFYYAGRYDSCAWYRYQALEMVEKAPSTVSSSTQLKVLSKILQFWMNAHEDIKNDRYIEQIMQRINVLEKKAIVNNDSSLLVSIYFQKAAYYHNSGKNDSARYYSNKNIVFGKRQHVVPSMIMSSYVNIGITYLDDKNPEMAIINMQKAINEAPKQGRSANRYIVFADILLGEAYCMQKQYKKAIDITVPALAKAESSKIISITDHAHQTLANAYEATGQFKKASYHRKQYAIIRDSLMKTEKLDLVYNVEIKSRIADKNREIAQQELAIIRNENRIKSKNFWIGGISIGLLLISVVTLLLYINNRNKQKLQTEKIRSLQQNMKIEQLNAMIKGEEKERSRIARELHDGMGGTLATVRLQMSAMLRKQGKENMPADFGIVLQLLEEASAELRTSAHNLMPEILLQEGLTKAVSLFCERVVSGSNMEISFESFGELSLLNSEFSLVVYRIVQELVNNIVKHAQATQALVQLNYHNGLLSITIEDNGKGMQPSNESSGMGIIAIKERVKSLNGHLDISSSAENGTSIYIEFSNLATGQQTSNMS